MADDPPRDDPHATAEGRFSDYFEGTLAEAERAEVKAHLDACESCRAAYAELAETMSALSGMKGKKEEAPAEFPEKVADTIHRRSAGRFFGRKTLGDRVPFGALLIVAIVVLGVTAAVLYSSTTGTLRTRGGGGSGSAQGSGRVVPTP